MQKEILRLSLIGYLESRGIEESYRGMRVFLRIGYRKGSEMLNSIEGNIGHSQPTQGARVNFSHNRIDDNNIITEYCVFIQKLTRLSLLCSPPHNHVTETMQIKAKKHSIQAIVQPQKKYERTSSLQRGSRRCSKLVQNSPHQR